MHATALPPLMQPVAHVIGGGLAGLAAAIAAGDAGYRVVLYEATSHFGGRCRAFDDPVTGCVLDNGTHLVMGCNHAVFAYLRRIHAAHTLRCVGTRFLMHDLERGLDYHVGGGWPRLPGVGGWDIVAMLGRVAASRSGGTVKDLIRHSPGLERLVVRPLSLAVLNTPPEQAASHLLRRTLWEVARGGRQGRTAWLPQQSLATTFVDPALGVLREQGVQLITGLRLKAIAGRGMEGQGRIDTLTFATTTVSVAAQDQVILALPIQALAGIDGVPPAIRAFARQVELSTIVNVHFHIPDLPHTPDLCGMVGGVSDWVFRKGDVVAVTISGANDLDVPDLAARVWSEVRQAWRLPPLPLPPHRVIREKQATPLQTPAFARNRPAGHAGRDGLAPNLWLVGDWTATGLPCTIESALRSGLGVDFSGR